MIFIKNIHNHALLLFAELKDIFPPDEPPEFCKYYFVFFF